MDRGFEEVLGFSFDPKTGETVRFGRPKPDSEERSDAFGWMDEADDACEKVILGKRPTPPKTLRRVEPVELVEPVVQREPPKVEEALSWMDECEEVIQTTRRKTEALKRARVKRETERLEAARLKAALEEQAKESRRKARAESQRRATESQRRAAESQRRAAESQRQARAESQRRAAESQRQARAESQRRARAKSQRRATESQRRATESQRRTRSERAPQAGKKTSRRTTVSLGWLDATSSDEQLIEPTRPTRGPRTPRRPQPPAEPPTRRTQRVEPDRAERKGSKRTGRVASARTARVESRRTERQPASPAPRRTRAASEVSLSPSEVQLLGKSPDEVFDGRVKKKKKKKKTSRRAPLHRDSGRQKRAELQRRLMESSDLVQALESGLGFAEPPTSFSPPPPRRESPFKDRPTPSKLDRLMLDRKLTESSCG